VIGRNATLPGIKKFAPSNPFGTYFKIGVIKNDARVFAPEFKRYWNQLGRGCLKHLAPRFSAANEKDMVERQF
jgi:hypothetical protein